jgi:hypothetical protein
MPGSHIGRWEEETQPRSWWIRHIGFVADGWYHMAVLVVPGHDATGSPARLEDASTDRLIYIEAQAAFDHGSSGAALTAAVRFDHAWAWIEMNWSDIYARAWAHGSRLTLILEPATVLISAGVDRAKGRKSASEMGHWSSDRAASVVGVGQGYSGVIGDECFFLLPPPQSQSPLIILAGRLHGGAKVFGGVFWL